MNLCTGLPSRHHQNPNRQVLQHHSFLQFIFQLVVFEASGVKLRVTASAQSSYLLFSLEQLSLLFTEPPPSGKLRYHVSVRSPRCRAAEISLIEGTVI